MSYQRALTRRLRHISAAGVKPPRVVQLAMAAAYVDRPLAPAGQPAAVSSAEAPQYRLAALAEPPGARVWLSGLPGIGKTTALRRLALACGALSAGEHTEATDLLDAWAEPIPLPVLLDLRALPPVDDVAAWLAGDGLAEFAADVHRALLAGSCLVLADGDGTPAEVEALAAVVARYPDNRFVVAAPPGAAPLDVFEPYTLPPLDRGQINELLARWITALKPDPSGALAASIEDLQGRLLLDDDLLELASWPPALALCALADVDGLPLPRARADLYGHLVDSLLLEAGRDLALGADALRRALRPLALELQERAVGGDAPELGTERGLELVRQELLAADAQPDAALAAIGRLARVGLLQLTDDALAMPHAALRQYLAADALAAAPDFAARSASLQASASWRKTLVLAAREIDIADPGASFAMVRRLGPAGSGTAGRPADWWQRALLAAEMMADIDGAAEREPQLVDEVRGALLALCRDGAVPLAERIRAGRLLGTIGDPRFADLLSDMVMIDGGPFVLGADVAGFDDEGPSQRIDVPMFRIGIYPVTNREYGRFLAASPDRPPPHYWRDPRFNNPSLPVVGVTWQDAAAYCAWLTREALADSLIPAGTVVRLPLEAEWEKAATWGPQARRKRAFPWGDAWDAARANTADGRGAWLTTPVGCYLGGVSQYGVHDMTGNIWEWTASEYGSYPGSRQSQHRAGHYVLRGSSCVSVPLNARATYRGSHLPAHYWRYHLGFRIVVGKPLPRSDAGA